MRDALSGTWMKIPVANGNLFEPPLVGNGVGFVRKNPRFDRKEHGQLRRKPRALRMDEFEIVENGFADVGKL